ncbi:TetR/AcrR family transcriptional regulator [Streptomonospora nanhaiensis]|uniref:AcrR family transcriptional regulator n=1 Tax=Streptomonospora nanhaiensis TaxID=1323731 RepID=A0A853BP95_9ACTN|nr:TetR family transcriptional regulator C-terminal domain-containing protein [Streptomonospora nanhaiensis]MBV2365195.1 TetR family transcriptional regulator C-terminal domain-containing protein [Streptomonospora nanhaiensis]MBX9387406.1 TetR family transcriptional regulator C-terminal domain-containing protein [Streptomonospora nanhaiensis]NYI97469.1 AcrR family transcriptional regulator [Streptomonospora nanhaiensis]
MPRTVDHAQRRTQIIEALLRVAGRDGLHAVTMRSVAAEAGVSLRLVQYYFHSKGRLVNTALTHLEERSNRRWAERMAREPGGSARAAVEGFLAEALPTDEHSRAFHLVFASFAVLAMTDPGLAEQPFVAGTDRIERRLTDLLARARDDGELAPDRDPAAEAARLLALNHGLGTDLLTGRRTPDSAWAVLAYHLDQVFTGADRAQGRSPDGL